jgi:hypothetical protein
MSTDGDARYPPPKPTSVGELETIIIARAHRRQIAHIPDHRSTDPSPLCVSSTAYETTWQEKRSSIYPAPDEWLTICEHCLAALDQEVDNA